MTAVKHNGAVKGILCGLGRIVAAPVVLMLLIGGCDISNLAFVKDTRIRIIEPQDYERVTLPMRLRWEVQDFVVTGRDDHSKPDAGYFAVFIDRPPLPPGRTLEWFAQQDGSCGNSSCGTVRNIAHVYTTKRSSVELTQLPAVRAQGDVERHEAVIVLLDGTGMRIGESAFRVHFDFKRKG